MAEQAPEQAPVESSGDDDEAVSEPRDAEDGTVEEQLAASPPATADPDADASASDSQAAQSENSTTEADGDQEGVSQAPVAEEEVELGNDEPTP